MQVSKRLTRILCTGFLRNPTKAAKYEMLKGKRWISAKPQPQMNFCVNGKCKFTKSGYVYSTSLLSALLVGCYLGYNISYNEKKKKTDVSLAAIKLDSLHDDSQYPRDELYKITAETFENDKSNVELGWRMARAMYEKAEDKNVDAKMKKELLYSTKSLLESLLLEDENNSNVHKWYGKILRAIAPYEGTRQSLNNTYIIKDHWCHAARENPYDIETHQLLGEWGLEMANMPWLEREVAKWLFWVSPPESSYEEALEYFYNAEALAPSTSIKTQLGIAKCEYHLEKTKEAVEWAKKAVKISVITEEDQELHDEAIRFLKKIYDYPVVDSIPPA